MILRKEMNVDETVRSSHNTHIKITHDKIVKIWVYLVIEYVSCVYIFSRNSRDREGRKLANCSVKGRATLFLPM